MSTTGVKSSRFYQYHQATKHTVESLFSSGHRLEWANQPDPFRHYDATELIDLPVADLQVSPRNFFEVLNAAWNGTATSIFGGEQRSPQVSFDEPVFPRDLSFISNLLFYGMSISAWKQVVGTTNRWALRVNASSGNLHPTETHILVDDTLSGLESGAYHYRVDEHRLEKRLKGNLIGSLMEYLALDGPPPPVVICLSSIFFREVWKYRQRGFRYCQHDLGHALAALSMSAFALNWDVRILSVFPDEEISSMLGLPSSQDIPSESSIGSRIDESDSALFGAERPLALMFLNPRDSLGASISWSTTEQESLDDQAKPHKTIASAWINKTLDAAWTNKTPAAGTPNKLWKRQIIYPVIERAYSATCYSASQADSCRQETIEFLKQATAGGESPSGSSLPQFRLPSRAIAETALARIPLPGEIKSGGQNCVHKSVHTTIRKRRSAVDMDGETGMTLSDLGLILRSASTGFLADFQGLDQFREGTWRAASPLHFIHLYLYVHRVQGLAGGLYYLDRSANELVSLYESDQREVAMSTSCFQDIAKDGAFSVSMIADFDSSYKLFGDRCYRLVHYEAGYIGQLLYLAACALGHDATGIGCFVDDAINNYLALEEGFEVIYNFTFGRAVHDPRLTTLPSYDFREPS